jgi:hypothetical protein
MLERLGLLLIVLLLASPFTVAQSDKTFFIDDEDLSHPLTVKELNRSGQHKVKISRHFDNEKEERLLRIAEAAYPRDREIRQNSRIRIEQPPGNERLWWCSSFDGVRIPYAITKSAVAYYLEVSEEFGKKNPREPFWTRMSDSSLTYSARLLHKESYRVGKSVFRNVYLVSMELEWSQYCGSLCAMAFKTSRTVVLTETGVVLFIENDRCAPYIVS